MAGGNGKATSPARALSTTTADQIHIRPVHWLWSERIPLGTLCLLGGREGVGKSLIAATLAAQVTRGTLPGARLGTPSAVILVASEDSWEHTIVPRLMAAGADLTRVHRLDVHTKEGAASTLSLPIDLPALATLILRLDAALLVLDPLLSRLSSELDTHKDADVRVALEPVVSLADTTHATVLGLIHVNKAVTTDPLTMLMGSRAFAAVSRSVLFVMPDPDKPETRLLGQPKNNLGRVDLPTLTFQLVGEKVADTPAGEVWTGKVQWLGDAETSISDAIAASTGRPDERSAVAEAKEWLEDYLSTQTDPTESVTVKKAGNRAGHTNFAIHKARQALHVVVQSIGYPRKTYWSTQSLARTRVDHSGSEQPDNWEKF